MVQMVQINAIDVPIRDGTIARTELLIGESERAFSGQMRSSRRAFKRKWSMETTILSRDDAFVLRDMLEGSGHNVSFANNLYAANGLAPQPGYDLTFNVGGGPSGLSNSVTLGSGVLAYDAKLDEGEAIWTIMVDKKTVSTWYRYAKTSAGTVYTDGFATGTAPWLTVSSGVAIITYGAGNTDFANLVILPWITNADYALSWGNVATSYLYPPLPQIFATGDFTTGGNNFYGYGMVDEMIPVQAAVSGSSFAKDNYIVRFTIEEA